MNGMNKVILLGNLGADPELRYTQSGTAVLNFRMGCGERWKGNDGTWKERTEWVSVTVWGARGEALSKIMRKGSSVLVEGSLRTRSYERDGQKRYTTEVVAHEVILTGGKPDGGHGDRGASKPVTDPTPTEDDRYDVGDLPF